MADAESVTLNAPHAPRPAAKEAFEKIKRKVAEEVIKSRHDWDKHEPRMWARAKGLSDSELTSFDVERDLVEVRTGETPYGTLIFGKIHIPAVSDDQGKGFIHVRIHHTPGDAEDQVKFHSLRTEESIWTAVLPDSFPLDFFNE
ncbi:hypothetical protein DL93DRAFT_2087204 [Clavulina sp. PMI_390]|nr:hypothetical protein DL93DRAFT_2087204 [Clavulina sp. PMI_390]